MSRSNYDDDYENLALWRQAVHRATVGYRGQAFLSRLRDALDALPVKRLIAGEPLDARGDVCALGALDPAFGAVVDYEDPRAVARHFGIARALAAEIVFMNDEWPIYNETPEQRWARMRAWVTEQLQP